jgi:hypothetical protein
MTNKPVLCRTCVWWKPRDKESGNCHRNAPLPPPNGQALDRVHWPITMYDDYCGDWAAPPVSNNLEEKKA